MKDSYAGSVSDKLAVSGQKRTANCKTFTEPSNLDARTECWLGRLQTTRLSTAIFSRRFLCKSGVFLPRMLHRR